MTKRKNQDLISNACNKTRTHPELCEGKGAVAGLQLSLQPLDAQESFTAKPQGIIHFFKSSNALGAESLHAQPLINTGSMRGVAHLSAFTLSWMWL